MFQQPYYRIDQKILVLKDTYKLRGPNKVELGLIRRKVLRLFSTFDIEDTTGAQVARVQGELSLRPSFEVTDTSGQKVGSVHRRIVVLYGSKYWVEDGNGTTRYKARGGFWHHTYRVKEPGRGKVAKIHLKWLRIADHYDIEILQDCDRLLVLALSLVIDQLEHEGRRQHRVGPDLTGGN